MATASQLMRVISEVTSVPLASLVDMDRRLVIAGLRTKGGRGFNAAQMVPVDAAHLLTAVLASPQANRSAETVARYTETRVDQRRSTTGLFAGLGIDDLASLKPSHGFVDGLAALLASAGSGAIANLIASADPPVTPQVEIIATSRATHGRIRITGLPSGLTASLEYEPKGRASVTRRAHYGHGDLEQSRRITERTIFAVAELLKE